ncbi:MAG TPA: DUF4383 domain-containing protein [Nitriliruptorales bacterium]
MNGNAVKLFGNVFGAIYALVGVFGFVVTGFVGFAATQGEHLLFFEINPLHNLVHLGVGVALMVAASFPTRITRAAVLTVGGVYAVVGVAGFFVAGTAANILALNTADHLLHLATALVAVAATVVVGTASDRDGGERIGGAVAGASSRTS